MIATDSSYCVRRFLTVSNNPTKLSTKSITALVQPLQQLVWSSIRLAAKDTLVIASDGLFDNLQIDEIVNIIRIGPLDKAAENLARTCRARMTEFSETRPHKPDDLGFILFRPGE